MHKFMFEHKQLQMTYSKFATYTILLLYEVVFKEGSARHKKGKLRLTCYGAE